MKKNAAMLDEAGLKDRSTIVVTISDKIPSASQSTRANKAKDEPKIPIIYTLRSHVPEAPAQVSEDDQPGEEQINTISSPPRV